MRSTRLLLSFAFFLVLGHEATGFRLCGPCHLLKNHTNLFQAIERNDHKRVLELIRKGIGLEDTLPDGTTPLMRATELNRSTMVRLLLCKKVLVNKRDKHGNTALHRAVTRGYRDIVELLLNYGAQLEVENSFGDTPLLIAVSQGFTATARLLIERGAAVTVVNKRGDTPLSLAQKKGYVHIARLLRSSQILREKEKDGLPQSGEDFLEDEVMLTEAEDSKIVTSMSQSVTNVVSDVSIIVNAFTSTVAKRTVKHPSVTISDSKPQTIVMQQVHVSETQKAEDATEFRGSKLDNPKVEKIINASFIAHAISGAQAPDPNQIIITSEASGELAELSVVRDKTAHEQTSRVIERDAATHQRAGLWKNVDFSSNSGAQQKIVSRALAISTNTHVSRLYTEKLADVSRQNQCSIVQETRNVIFNDYWNESLVHNKELRITTDYISLHCGQSKNNLDWLLAHYSRKSITTSSRARAHSVVIAENSPILPTLVEQHSLMPYLSIEDYLIQNFRCQKEKVDGERNVHIISIKCCCDGTVAQKKMSDHSHLFGALCPLNTHKINTLSTARHERTENRENLLNDEHKMHDLSVAVHCKMLLDVKDEGTTQRNDQVALYRPYKWHYDERSVLEICQCLANYGEQDAHFFVLLQDALRGDEGDEQIKNETKSEILRFLVWFFYKYWMGIATFNMCLYSVSSALIYFFARLIDREMATGLASAPYAMGVVRFIERSFGDAMTKSIISAYTKISIFLALFAFLSLGEHRPRTLHRLLKKNLLGPDVLGIMVWISIGSLAADLIQIEERVRAFWNKPPPSGERPSLEQLYEKFGI